jgi:hypothetical protein
MSFRSSITIVASPRPRVGKTLLARLLTDFHLHEGRLVTAFDLNTGDGTLAQFLPEKTATASIRDVNGQMALFDHLVAYEDITKVIDVGHEAYEGFFSLAHNIGFVDEARRRSIAVAILFMVTPDHTSVTAYRSLRERFMHATLAPVHNEILGPAQHRDKYPLASGGPGVVRMAALAPGLRRYIDTPPFSFADPRIADPNRIPETAYAELERWLRRIYLEFRELDLRILLADLRSSIQFSSQSQQ